MKRLMLLFVLMFAAATAAVAQTEVTVNFTFKGFTAGSIYDNDTKSMVYIKKSKVAETSVKKVTEGNSVTFKVNKKKTILTIRNFTLVKGKWEEHLEINDFKSDFYYSEPIEFRPGKCVIDVTFDIDYGTVVKVTYP